MAGAPCGADWAACVRIAPIKRLDALNHADTRAVRTVPESRIIQSPSLVVLLRLSYVRRTSIGTRYHYQTYGKAMSTPTLPARGKPVVSTGVRPTS